MQPANVRAKSTAYAASSHSRPPRNTPPISLCLTSTSEGEQPLLHAGKMDLLGIARNYFHSTLAQFFQYSSHEFTQKRPIQRHTQFLYQDIFHGLFNFP